MMYKANMALAVKVSERVLRERDDKVYVPYNTEYSLFIKNVNSMRALVKVSIDGVDVTEGTSGLIIEPNSSIDLERSIKNGNLNQGNKFKFIERTEQISKHRGNRIDDGLIRVTFEFEKKIQPVVDPVVAGWPRPIYQPNYWLNNIQGIGSTTAGNSDELKAQWMAMQNVANVSQVYGCTQPTACTLTTSHSDVGITVPGAVSNQHFSVGSWFPTDGVKHVMVLQLLGETETAVVKAPVVVVKKELTCPTCGKRNKQSANFCSGCGTSTLIL